MKESDRQLFELFCTALQSHPRPVTQEDPEFFNTGLCNHWSVKHVEKARVDKAFIVHRLRLYYISLPIEPVIEVVVHEEQDMHLFNMQIANAARRMLGSPSGKRLRKWNLTLW
jgi:hypothetical protein